MSWNLPEPVDSETAAAKVNKDGSDITNPSNWPFPEETAPMAAKAFASQWLARNFGAGVLFSNAVSERITCYLNQGISQTDYSMHAVFRVPLANPSTGRGILAITGSAANGLGNTSIQMGINATGELYVAMRGATTADARRANLPSFIAGYGGLVVAVTITRKGNTLKMYINGQDTVYVETVQGTPPAWGDTIDSIYMQVGIGNTTSDSFYDRIYMATEFNRALSAADVAILVQNGVGAMDRSGSMTPVYVSGFGTDVNGWAHNSEPNLTLTGNVDGIGGQNDNLGVSNATGSPVGCKITRSSTVVMNKRFRVTFQYFAEAASGLAYLGIGDATIRLDSEQHAVVEGAWTTWTGEVVCDTNSLKLATFTTATGITIDNLEAGKAIYFRAFSILQIGVLVDLDMTVGIGRFFPDRSSNKAHGESNVTLEHLLPRTSGDLCITKKFLHSDISATAATTLLLTLPPNCGIADIEIDRDTAMDGGTTLDIGITGTPAKFVSAANMAATGKLFLDSLSKVSESATGDVSIWVKKSGVTTVGSLTIRIRFIVRGGK